MARELGKAARGTGEDVAAYYGLVKMIPQWEREHLGWPSMSLARRFVLVTTLPYVGITTGASRPPAGTSNSPNPAS